MKYLLDTHIWLWLLTTPERVGDTILNLISDDENDLYLSAASTWEIAIKYKLGKLPLPQAPTDYVPSRMEATGVQFLPIGLEHSLHVAELPEHHRDPFDRLLVSQASIENLIVITADKSIEKYEVDTILID